MSNLENAVALRLEAERKGLLDLSLRNPLLNYRPRVRGLEFVGESPAQLVLALVRDGKRLAFLPTPEPNDGDASAATDERADGDRLLATRTDFKLQSALPAAAMQARLLAVYYTARTALEEQGVNTLFLALGMLEWSTAEERSQTLRAPLLLIPVALERLNARDRFRLRATDDEPEINLSLIEKLRSDHGLQLPERPEEGDLDVDRYLDDVASAVEDQPRWRVIRDAVALGFFSFGKFLMYRDLEEEVWPKESRPSRHPILGALLREGFDRRDPSSDDEGPLDGRIAPIEGNLVVDADSTQALAILDVSQGRNLVIQGPPGTGKSQTIANLIADAIGRGRTVLFVAEKMAALDVVKRRLDRVGLGDACLELHSHKANRKALLGEIRRTLELGKPRLIPFDDDLRILLETRDRLNAYCEAVNTPIGESGVSPYQAYGELLRLRERASGEVPRPLEITGIASWSVYELRRRRSLVEELQSRLLVLGLPADHPFRGCRRSVFLPTERDRLIDLLATARRATIALRETSNALAGALGLPASASVADVEVLLRGARRVTKAAHLQGADVASDDWLAHRKELLEVLDSGQALGELHQRLDPVLLPDAWDDDLKELRRDLNADGRNWWSAFSGSYRRARRRVASLCRGTPPRGLEAQLELVDAVLSASRHRNTIRRGEELAQRLFATRWQGERSNWESLAHVAKWVVQLHLDVRSNRLPAGIIGFLESHGTTKGLDDLMAAVKSARSEHQGAIQRLATFLDFDPASAGEPRLPLEDRSLGEQVTRLELWSDRLDDLPALIAFNQLAGRCRTEGLGEAVALAECWPGAALHLVSLFDRHRVEALLDAAFRQREPLARFDGQGQAHQIQTFRNLDQLWLKHNRARLALEHWSSLPRHEGGGQLAVLRREFEKKSRHLPVRQLLARAGNAVRAIKPVFMMSPLSIAGYLEPGALSFDLVIFDEASQVKPVDALGAILRGKQVVVVGDSRQLPPSNFFDRLTGEAEGDDDEGSNDLESILGLFASQGAPERLLRWHYRSRHESLIAVSNREFYDGRLVVFPSPDAGRRSSGLILRHLPSTAYDRGGSRTNRGEAEAVALSVFDFARSQLALPAERRLTLGVVAFGVPQMECIRDQIERLRHADPSCEAFFTPGVAEPFFVKNLENVQGDERDVVFISIGYGKDADGDLAMNFGPLNGDGGERRLNVLITRARVRCEVFTNLDAEDIDLSRSQAPGIRALKTFLAYAKDRGPGPPSKGEDDPAPAFEDEVRATLTASGCDVIPRVGGSGFGPDLAAQDLREEGRFSLGLLCDGPSYQSARSARDRDRLRSQVLESLGWRLERIWSTDWVRNPSGESKRVQAAIAAAREIPPQAGPLAPAAPGVEDSLASRDPSDLEAPAVDRDVAEGRNADPPPIALYRIAAIDGELGGIELETLPPDRFVPWIVKVVEIESPVTFEEVVARIASAGGLKRVPARLRGTLEAASERAIEEGSIRRQGDFLWERSMLVPVLRDRRELPSTSRRLDLITDEELALAVEKVVEDALGMESGAISTAACHALGFPKVGEEMRNRVEGLVSRMIEDRRLAQQGGYVVVGEYRRGSEPSPS